MAVERDLVAATAAEEEDSGVVVPDGAFLRTGRKIRVIALLIFKKHDTQVSWTDHFKHSISPI